MNIILIACLIIVGLVILLLSLTKQQPKTSPDDALTWLTCSLTLLFCCPVRGDWNDKHDVFDIYIMEYINGDKIRMIKVDHIRKIELELGIRIRIHNSNDDIIY